jgi:alpha-glucosidase
MPWSATEQQAGFSLTANTWLPVAKTHLPLAVDAQQTDEKSLLKYYTQLLMWRRGVPALIKGSMQLLPKDSQVLAFVREHLDAKVLCVFNFSREAAVFELPKEFSNAVELQGSGLSGGYLQDKCVQLTPWGGLFVSVQ